MYFSVQTKYLWRVVFSADALFYFGVRTKYVWRVVFSADALCALVYEQNTCGVWYLVQTRFFTLVYEQNIVDVCYMGKFQASVGVLKFCWFACSLNMRNVAIESCAVYHCCWADLERTKTLCWGHQPSLVSAGFPRLQ